MQSNENFTEKPKTKTAEDLEEESAYHERIEDIEDSDDDDDDEYTGLNEYIPYAGFEGGEY